MKRENELITPDVCSSLNECFPPNPHCVDCSHAYFSGKVSIGEDLYKFDFNPQYGVEILGEDGEPREVVFDEDHEFWDGFYDWYNEKFK